MVSLRIGGQQRARGGLVTVAVVIGLVAVITATLVGLGVLNNVFANYDTSSWLFSSQKGDLSRVNGTTGRVDALHSIADSRGHTVQVSQSDRYVVLHDLDTGKISVLDLATLQIGATTQRAPGIGVSIAMHDDAVFVIDGVQGSVGQLDPATLRPIGTDLPFLPGLTGGAFDGRGRLWLLLPGEGTVVGISPAPTGSGAAGSGTGPRIFKQATVADPSHDLTLTVLDDGVAVLDTTANVLTMLRDSGTGKVTLPLTGIGAVPVRSNGATLAVTVVSSGHVYIVAGGKLATDFAVPGASPRLKPCVAWAARFYCADEATGTVYVFETNGRPAPTITLPNAGGVLELEVREDHLFINAPNSSFARVVNNKGDVKNVDKYPKDVLGANPPSIPPPPPPSPPSGVPSAPSTVVATAGNATARVTWGAANPNGSEILKYVVEGDGQSYDVGAKLRAKDITGLTNGKAYTFTVRAVNGYGTGPKGTAKPVTPTSDVPDAPTSVTAVANPDGTVKISWPAANGLGHKIASYQVTSISVVAGSAVKALVGSTTLPGQTSLDLAAGTLTYGTQYAFTVVAINDISAGSKDSPVSNSVTPFTKPGLPKNLTAVTADAKGAVQASWNAADSNGSVITKYVVTATSGATKVSQDVTAGTTATLSDPGFADGAVVSLTVAAVNVAGTGPTGTATARTMVPPTITLTANPAPGYRSYTVNFSINGGGGSTACTISVNGGPATPLSCGGQPIGAVPATTYNYTVTVTNKVGSASASGSQTTPTMFGTVGCRNDPTYCSGGIWIYNRPTQTSTGIRALYNGNRFQAVCWVDGGANGRVDARPWGGTQSTIWIRLTDNNYFPYAWGVLDGGNSLNNLAAC